MTFPLRWAAAPLVWRAALLLLLASSAALSTASAGENYAFLVGVADYDRKELKPLQFTRSDILELHQVLVESGYDKANIVLMHDDLKLLPNRRYFPEAAKIREELKLLLAVLDKEDTLIVAFSGHGVQFKGQKQNYFCPADAKLDDPKTLIALSDLYATLEKCAARQKLLLVDACRDDPQSALGKARQSVDLESVTRPQTEAVPEGLVALFSCAAGQRSFEDPDLKHGVFFYHVLEGLKGAARNADNEVTLDDLVSFTRRKTQTFARTSLAAIQTPQQLGDFTGAWVLRSLKTPTPGKPIPPIPPRPGNDAKSIVSASTGMKLLLIPAGEYQRGTSDAEIDRLLKEDSSVKRESFADEQPQHTVKISNPFYVGRTEVTQSEWATVMGTNPSWFSKTGSGSDKVSGDTSRYPLDSVSWYDAVEYCVKLSEQDGLPPYYRLGNVERNEDNSIKKAEVTVLGGKGYRLPTEAEWEYAARAKTTTRFPFGDSNNGTQANIDGNYPTGTTTKGPYLERTTTVGSYAENAFGLVDTCGNVWEWCEDWYDAEAYKAFTPKAAADPIGDASEHKNRILRGGSWNDYARASHSAKRSRSSPDNRYLYYGFRLARTP